MRVHIALFVMLIVGACAVSDPRECVDPSTRAQAIVKLDDAQGTAFLTKPNEMVTVQHVSEQLGMSSDWQLINLSQRQDGPYDSWTARRALMRIKHTFFHNLPEALHVLEIRGPYASEKVATVALREKPLLVGEKVTAVGYAAGMRTFATGYYVGRSFGLSPWHGFNLTDGSGSYPITRGASGGPIFDCEGLVVSTIARATGTASYPGFPNVQGIPVNYLARTYEK